MLRYPLVALTAALSMTTTAVWAAPDLPKRKSGLWEMTMSHAGAPSAMKMQMCVDEKTDDMARSTGAQMDMNCSKNEIKREGSRVVSESVCKMGQTTATTRGVFTGDFSTAYTFETKTTYDPPLMGMGEAAMKGSARWTGPCKSDMKPGDVIMPNGMKMNMNDRK
jgi:hypothetical protein